MINMIFGVCVLDIVTHPFDYSLAILINGLNVLYLISLSRFNGLINNVEF